MLSKKMELKERYAQVLRTYFIPFDTKIFLHSIQDTITRLPVRLGEVGRVFSKSLLSTISIASVPYGLTESAVRHRRFQLFLTAQRIRSLNIEEEKDRDTWALRTARENFEEFLKSDVSNEDQLGQIPTEILDELGASLENDQFRDSMEELLRQCTVLCWSAFEVLCSDFIVELINSDPLRSLDLLTDSRTKRYYDQKEFVSNLKEYNFDLSHRMGSVLIRQRRVDDVDTIRNVFDVLFGKNTALRSKLQDEQLWNLWQDRNLIVHRRGIVDEHFMSKRMSTMAIGSELKISSDRFEAYLKLVAITGETILRCGETLGTKNDSQRGGGASGSAVVEASFPVRAGEDRLIISPCAPSSTPSSSSRSSSR